MVICLSSGSLNNRVQVGELIHADGAVRAPDLTSEPRLWYGKR